MSHRSSFRLPSQVTVAVALVGSGCRIPCPFPSTALGPPHRQVVEALRCVLRHLPGGPPCPQSRCFWARRGQVSLKRIVCGREPAPKPGSSPSGPGHRPRVSRRSGPRDKVFPGQPRAGAVATGPSCLPSVLRVPASDRLLGGREHEGLREPPPSPQTVLWLQGSVGLRARHSEHAAPTPGQAW